MPDRALPLPCPRPCPRRRLALLVVLALHFFCWTGGAAAQPVLPVPTLRELMSSEQQLLKARLHFVRLADGDRAEVVIEGGNAESRNPHWALGRPVHLPFDMARHRELLRVLKKAQLGAPTGPATPGPDDRSLELWGRGSAGWQVVARWTLPRARWQKRYKALFQLLEPLFQVPDDLQKLR